jgi:RND family efflux transporter MFP subunit
MFGWAARDQFRSSTPVTVVPVVVTRADVQQSGTPLFQAAGWIEPRPTPLLVPALAEGVVAELLVVEGQDVAAGQPVARLIEVDARLALEQAQADLQLREAELQSAEAEQQAARLQLENPVHLQAALAEARSQLTKAETELARNPFLVQAAEARYRYAVQSLEAKQSAGAAIPGDVLRQAQSEHDRAEAELRELQARLPRLEQEAAALRERQEALALQLELLVDEKRRASEADAQVKAAQAREHQARLAIQAAQVRLDRMTVTAPVAGRILSLVARPGSRVAGLDTTGDRDTSTVVTMYDPQMLQVRADVRLEDVPLVQPGQPVTIETASAKEPLRGFVLTATAQANIQKNTLEVKVSIDSPPPTIRPEMLVTAVFLAPEPAANTSGGDESPPARLLVPRQMIVNEGSSSAVWVADPDGKARLRQVRLGTAGTAELIEVLEGLTPTDRLISDGRESLHDGDSIRIVGEDNHTGVSQTAGSQ